MRLRTAVLILLAACTSNRDRALKELGLTVVPDDDGGMTTAQTFKPDGCAYTVTVPVARGFTGFALDSAASVSMADGAPIRTRLGLGGAVDSSAAGYADPSTTVAFTWETTGDIAAAKVRYGKGAGPMDKVQKGYSWTTPPPQLGLGTSEAPVHMHEVHLCGLEPATTYSYQVGGGAPGSEVWGDTQSFTTPPATGKIVIGVSGDARDSADVWTQLQRRFRDNSVSMQVFTGDLVLAGTVESLFVNWLTPVWKDAQQPGKFVTLGQQLMVFVAGNHENASSQFYGNFALPGDASEYAETFGSFNVGNAHFAFIDDQRVSDNTTGDQATAQLKWLEADLDRANKDRAKHPFIVFMNHRPEFSTSRHKDDGDTQNVRNALVPIFDEYNVDLVLGGHDHEFERSKPVKGPYASPSIGQGTTYVVCAGAGADAYGTGAAAYSEKAVAFGNGTNYLGVYSLMTIEGNTLRMQSFGLRASGMDDPIDDFTLTH
jgi:predicted phosphodiesterase